MLAVGFVILAVLMACHLFLTLALVSRVRVIEENKPPANPDMPAPGDVVAPFEVLSTDGARLTDATLATGTTLVGFFAPHCGSCEKARIALLDRPPRMPMLAFIDGTDDDAASRHIGIALGPIARVAYTATNDSVARAFRQVGYPTFVRVENGTVKRASHNLADVMA